MHRDAQRAKTKKTSTAPLNRGSEGLAFIADTDSFECIDDASPCYSQVLLPFILPFRTLKSSQVSQEGKEIVQIPLQLRK